MIRFPHMLLLVGCAVLLVASSAMAASCPQTNIARPSNPPSNFEIGRCAYNYTGITYQPYEFTTKLVTCIEGTIRDAVLTMMDMLRVEFGWVTALLGTLVIIFHGMRVMMGERDLLKRTATLTLKIAFVVGFINMLPTVVDWVYGVFADLLRLVSGGRSPWQQIDEFLGKLIGFGPSIVLLNGLLGLVGAAIFSSSVGITMFSQPDYVHHRADLYLLPRHAHDRVFTGALTDHDTARALLLHRALF